MQRCSHDVLSYGIAAVHRAWLPLGCRKAIRELGTPVSAELADEPDLALREAVRESGLLMHCRGAFIVSNTGNVAQEPLRKLVIDLLQVCTAQYMHPVKRANKELISTNRLLNHDSDQSCHRR